MKNGRRALYIGRFQPFHLGHLSVVEQMEHNPDIDEIIIGIGSSQLSGQENNPYSSSLRRTMIASSINVQKTLSIHDIPDIPDDHRWIGHVISIVGPVDVVYTANPWVEELFTARGIKVIQQDFKFQISATLVRSLLNQDGDWQSLVPKGTREIIDNLLKNNTPASI